MAKKVTIGIGEYYASDVPAVIYTLLGSCVAVCLFDPVNRVGGMNHILLPGKADLRHYDNRARFGINAMEQLINQMMQMGANKNCFKAKFFGGANVLSNLKDRYHIGVRIVDFVRNFLVNEGFDIISHDCGGREIRKVFFHTDTGEVFLKKSESARFSDIANKEKKWFNIIREEVKKPGKIEIFEKKRL